MSESYLDKRFYAKIRKLADDSYSLDCFVREDDGMARSVFLTKIPFASHDAASQQARIVRDRNQLGDHDVQWL